MEVAYCVTPIENCPHLESMKPLPEEGLDLQVTCPLCSDPVKENWVCLHCYKVFCGRFVKEHMVQHNKETQHNLTLSYADLSVWCYGCDAYVHNDALKAIKDHAASKKFA